MKQEQDLHITFHNPNTEEETAKFLAKVIASSLTDHIIQQQTNFPRESSAKRILTVQY